MACMGRKTDIGSYFDQITKRGSGGRRLDDGEDRSAPAGGTGGSSPTSGGSAGTPSPGGRLRDVIEKGRDVAKRATDKARNRTAPTSPSRPAPPIASEAVVVVEYTPRMDGDPDPGDVVWVWVPFEEDPTQGKDRPVVVIGRRAHTLVGIPLTTKRDDREAQVEVGVGDWDPKRRVSYARIWRMLDIDGAEMRREGAMLERDRFDRIITAVDRYYETRRVEAAQTPRRRTAEAPADDDY